MKRKVCIAITVVCLLLLGWWLLPGQEQPLVSQLSRQDCFVCGELGDTGDIGILNLNTMDLLCIDLRCQETDGAHEVSMEAQDGTRVETTAYPNRGYAYGQIIGSQGSIDRGSVQAHLCQNCLDGIDQTDPVVYVLVDFAERTIQPLVKGSDWLYMGDFKIGCAFEGDGTIKLLIQDTSFLMVD